MGLSLGITPWRETADHGPDSSLRDQAVRAEELGFDSFFLAESHFFVGAQPSPLSLLAFVAGCTERIKLGTSSLLLPMRDPVLLAEEIATVDQVSGGRLILGLGRGFRNALFEVFGVDRSRKRDLLEASLDRLVAAWSGKNLLPPGEESSPGGDRNIRLFPLPKQKPHPPLWMAAFGPKALKQAARLGLPYLASPLEAAQQLAANYISLDRTAVELGVPFSLERPVMRTVFVHADATVREGALLGLEREHDKWKRTAAPFIRSALEAPLADRVVVGDAAEVRDRLSELVTRLSITHLIASCRVPGVETHEVDAAVEGLAELKGDLVQSSDRTDGSQSGSAPC